MATKYEILKKRRVNRAKKKARLKRRAQEHFQARKTQQAGCFISHRTTPVLRRTLLI